MRITMLMIAGKLLAIAWLGFGDSEALYASYPLVLQPTYLDHPGLIALIARGLGALSGTTIPSPLVAHVFTSVVASFVPYLGVLSARAAGASHERSWITGLALIAAPEVAVGLLGLTPDLPLAVTWMTTLALVSTALRSSETQTQTQGSRGTTPRSRWGLWILAGLSTGLACWSKASGALLLVSLCVLAIRGVPLARTARRSPDEARPSSRYVPGVAVAIVIASVIALPMLVYEAREGWPMVHHRLVATQSRAGFSLRNLGALIGGQLAYVSPLLAIAGVLAALRLVRTARSPVDRWLRDVTSISAAGLGLLCLWSRVAEPHWFAPVWLGVALWISTIDIATILPRWLRVPSLLTGLSFSLVVHLYVLTDLFPGILGGTRLYQGRYDLASDMRLWRIVSPRLRRLHDERESPVVLTPHWTLAAQVQVILGPRAAVIPAPSLALAQVDDDFRRWFRRHEGPWAAIPRTTEVTSVVPGRLGVMVVWDDRFPRPEAFTTCERHEEIPLERGGYVVRTAVIETGCR